MLFIAAFISPFVISKFNPSFPYYRELLIGSNLPNWIWPFANFDGVHYITIASRGYVAEFTQAFFPLYPFLVNIFAFNKFYLLSALLIANFSFLLMLFVLYKLFNLDYDKKISLKSIILVMAFPTAFYFGSVYTESIFFLFVVSFLLFARKRYFLLAGLIGAFAALTRLNGVFLSLVLAIEVFIYLNESRLRSKVTIFKLAISILLPTLGTLVYMIYLKLQFNNPLYFLTAQPFFGASRSESIILFPQVIYRYIKILLTVHWNSYPYFNAILELGFTLFAIYLLIISFKKVRFSYWFFVLCSIILPTLTGTLSSMPRYTLVTLLLFPLIIKGLGKRYNVLITLFIILQFILSILFLRGYWIA